jgi:DNA-binding GntR family transcriptional regulator
MKTNSIVEQITRAIIDRKLPPGAKLNERDLGEAFQVSRTIVRQALDRLQQDGLVSISPKRATTVVKPTIEEAHQLFDAIGMIEGAVIERIAKIGAKNQIEVLKKHVALERKAAAAGHRQQANQLGRDFHELFVGLVGNPVLAKAHSQLLRQQALITSLFRTEFDYDGLQHDHAAVVDFLEQGDVKAAKDVLASHYKLVILGYQFKDGECADVDIGRVFTAVDAVG